jgi:FlaA1/EpsC-like NDP-sugar epimerase
MIYRYAYKCGTQNSIVGVMLFKILRFFGGKSLDIQAKTDVQLIKIAIVGAGRVGTSLAEDLINNKNASHVPRCFIDINEDKVQAMYYSSVISQLSIKLFPEEVVQWKFFEPLITNDLKSSAKFALDHSKYNPTEVNKIYVELID